MSIVAIVCGGRDLRWTRDHEQLLYDFHATHFLTYVIVGSNTRLQGGWAVGADAHASDWAERQGSDRLCHDANWRKYARPYGEGANPAGPIRNGELLELQEDIATRRRAERVVLALPGNRGTADMCRQAAAANVNVVRYHAPERVHQGSLL